MMPSPPPSALFEALEAALSAAPTNLRHIADVTGYAGLGDEMALEFLRRLQIGLHPSRELTQAAFDDRPEFHVLCTQRALDISH